ncbi:MAG: SDR family NAD(P)-dependent oxidoreductase [Kangiellaceae bacterium]|nr:SDR family NAD(P)-dependent oxidoreductase [Kangiellaceae bacterium]
MAQQTIVFTSGSSGLETARLLIENKITVLVLNNKSSVDLENAKAKFCQCDLQNVDEIKFTFEQTKNKHKHKHKTISALIDNADMLSYGNIEKLSINDWQRVININPRDPSFCAKRVIPFMNKGSVIINVVIIQSILP